MWRIKYSDKILTPFQQSVFGQLNCLGLLSKHFIPFIWYEGQPLTVGLGIILVAREVNNDQFRQLFNGIIWRVYIPTTNGLGIVRYHLRA